MPRRPSESKVEVAVEPNHAWLVTESWVVEAISNEERPVKVDAPVMERDPNVPSPVVVKVSSPRSIAPKPEVMEPELRAPT